MIGHTHNLSPYFRDLVGDNERQKQTDQLALEVLTLARNSLLIHLRFMDSALIRMIPTSSKTTADLATDGQYLYFYPVHVLRAYKAARETVVRDYLHAVLHCVFRHPFVGERINITVWSLACDIAVEQVITSLAIPAALSPRAARQADALARLGEEVRPLTAEKLYRYFMGQEEEAGIDYAHLRDLFYADDHAMWFQPPAAGDGAGTKKDTVSDDDAEEQDGAPLPGLDGGEEETAPPEDGEQSSGGQGGQLAGDREDRNSGERAPGPERAEQGERQPALSREELEKLWKDIGQRIQVDLETVSSTWGESSGDMMQQLKALNRETYDYAAFLRRFTTLGEHMEVNDDEFDYILYTYGLRIFENMPLVEPLEYKEVRRIREFVIALDTSQSVSGNLVQAFVNKTYNIIKQSENFFTKINLHIIQCGASIQEDRKITCQEEFDQYMKTMRLYGFGGTDFRPVFSYTDELIRNHEFTNFKGLIYFTDGYGTFPASRPDYDAAFVFCSDRDDTPDVPPWAIKLVLTPEEIEGC